MLKELGGQLGAAKFQFQGGVALLLPLRAAKKRRLLSGSVTEALSRFPFLAVFMILIQCCLACSVSCMTGSVELRSTELIVGWCRHLGQSI